MTSPRNGTGRIRFDIFEADLHTEELCKSGRKLRLPNQSFRVLAMLLDKAGGLVTREELCARLWPAGTFVEHDGSLNAAVNRLREALGDSAEQPRFIETLPKRGYRFVAAIDRAEASPAEAVQRDEAPLLPPIEKPGNRFGARFLITAGLCGVVVIAVSARIFTKTSETPHPLESEVIPFTTLPGKEISPTFSPDGSQIAFAWNGDPSADQKYDLFVKSIGSDRMLRITNSPSSWISAAWSPDGTSIAFVRMTEEDTGIFVVPALGGSERRIVSGGVAVGHFMQIGWSADGKHLAYSAYGSTGGQEIFTVSLDTLVSRPLSPAPACWDAAEPVYSPDGKRLAFVCTSSVALYDVYVASMPDGRLQRLVSMSGDAQGLTWSSDSRRIVLSNDTGDGGALWSLTMDGQLSRQSFGESGTGPAIRGSRLAYVRGQDTIDIWRFDLTDLNPEKSAQKLIYSTREQMQPRYSQDGTRIAFQSNRSGRTEIWVSDAQGGEATRATSFDGPYTSAPSWCSDGRRIAFDSRASGVSAVYIEDITERLPRTLDTSHHNLSLPVWSADCKWIFASDGRAALYRIPAAGGSAQRFTDLPAVYASVSGTSVIFAVTEPTGVVLWAKPVDGGAERRVDNMPKLPYADAWATNATGIVYSDSSTRPISVNQYTFADRTSRKIMTVKNAPVPGGASGLTVSADGRWLLISEVDDAQSDIMLGPSP